MKFGKKILVTLMAFTVAFALAACTAKNQTAFEPQGTVVLPEKDGLICSSKVQPNIICNDTEGIEDLLEEISMSVFSTTYMTPHIYSEKQSQVAHEIVIGETQRDISKLAYRYLERLDHEIGEVSYLIYSNGSSVAIAYDKDEYKTNATLICALESLLEYFDGDSEIIIPKGVVSYDSFDALEYQKNIDNAEKEKQWASFVDQVNAMGADGEAIAKAIQDYYSVICTDNVISWFANLYDPETGGYYFSNDARNTEGFLPDIESTQQAIGFFESSGMFDSVNTAGYDGSGFAKYMCGLPEWFRTQVVVFLKSLQDPETGFFYHPQWTKEAVNSHLNRRARDLNRAVGILQYFGSNPTYDTPNGDTGDGITWEEYLAGLESSTAASITGRLMYNTAASAVSKVVPASTAAVASHLVSVSTFKAYLAEKLARREAGLTTFYAIGNEIGTQVTQIQKRDKELDPTGNTQPLGDTLIAWYTEHQNKETGLWDDGLSYDNTNALLKIGGQYTDFGYIFPNADKAFDSCVELLMTEEEPSAIVEVYNVWYSIYNLMENVNKLATSADEIAYANSVRLHLLEIAPKAIAVSAEKQLLFKQPDGSFSYSVGKNCQTSQGLPVAPPGDGEGDVNATTIGMSGTINNCLKALGIYGITPSFFGTTERLEYLAILEQLGPVIKDDTDIPISYDDFDFEDLGENPDNFEFKNHANGTLSIVKRNDEAGGYAMAFDHKGGYEKFNIDCQTGALSSSCFVFESDLMVSAAEYDTSKETTIVQLIMQPSTYMLTVRIGTDGNVRIVESSSTTWKNAKEQDLGVRFALGEWFNVKVKYYVGDHDTVRIKVYINGELVAVTDNYFDSAGTKLTDIGTPSEKFEYVTVTGLSTSVCTLCFDNVAAYKRNEVYKPVSANQSQPAINVDPPDSDRITYDFEEKAIPENITVSSGDITVESGALKVSGSSDLNVNISLPINIRYAAAACSVLNTKIKVSEGSSGTVARFYFTENAENSTPVTCFDLVTKVIDGVTYTVIAEAPDGKQGLAISGTEVAIGEEFELRIEYYEEERVTLFYIDGSLVGFSSSTCKNAEKYTVRTLVVTSAASSYFEVFLDDLVFEKDIIDFTTSTTSDDYPRVNYDFDGTSSDITLGGGASADGGFLKLGKTDAQATIPLTDRNIITSAVSASFDIVHDGLTGSYVFTLLDESGLEIISFELNIDEETIEIYEYYAGGRGICLGSTALTSSDFTLSFKYYYKQSIMNIYVGKTVIGTTALTHLYDRDSLTPAAVGIKQISGISSLNIDSCFAERTVDLYKSVTSEGVASPEAESMITFESSSLDNYPKTLTSTLSANAQVAIKALMNGTSVSKVLAFKSVAGVNDSLQLSLQTSDKMSGATVLVYEADMMFDLKEGSSEAALEIYFRKGSSYDTRYLIYFEDGKTGSISDWYSGQGKEIALNVSEGTLFNIRIEYTLSEGSTIANIFINGEYFRSCERTGTSIAVEDIDKAVFYAQNALDGSVYFDNVKFYQTNTLTPIE